MKDWRPLSYREGRASANYDGPYDGVPEWLFGPLWQWICDRYYLWTGKGWRRAALDEYRAIAAMLRISLENPRDPTPSDARGMRDRLHLVATESPDILLDIVDYWLATTDFRYAFTGERGHADDLNQILDQAGSIYHVQGTEQLYLARRVAPEIQVAADKLIDQGRAGEHLGRAWQAIYGRSPNPSEGYREAIKAVEAAAKPVVSPANGRATLGTIIRDMNAKPNSWTVRLRHHDADRSLLAVVGMLDLLWAGQTGRHGDPDPARPLDVPQEDAEAALHLALALVYWFTSGVVAVR